MNAPAMMTTAVANVMVVAMAMMVVEVMATAMSLMLTMMFAVAMRASVVSIAAFVKAVVLMLGGSGRRTTGVLSADPPKHFKCKCVVFLFMILFPSLFLFMLFFVLFFAVVLRLLAAVVALGSFSFAFALFSLCLYFGFALFSLLK